MLEVLVFRFVQHGPLTLGTLLLDGELACFTAEDVERDLKLPGLTAIPRGQYRLELRSGSPMAGRYDRAYADIEHDGMIWLRDVPFFQYVYLHVGNDPEDTEGCILVGEQATMSGVAYSRDAYRSIYPRIAAAIRGNGARLTVCGAHFGAQP